MDPKEANDDNRANQLNANNDEYRGDSDKDDRDHDYDNDNQANQLNPNHDEYQGD